MAFENNRGSGSGSGWNRFVPKSYFGILKNASSFSDKSSDLDPFKLMEKLNGEKSGDFLPSMMSDNIHSVGRAESAIGLLEKKGSTSFAGLWNTSVDYENNSDLPNRGITIQDSEQIDQPQKEVKRRTVKRQRRCWTPELHSLFVDAIEKIGGAEAATPKHILERMQVDGLTADEVKSHLQKFRVHMRKFAP